MRQKQNCKNKNFENSFPFEKVKIFFFNTELK